MKDLKSEGLNIGWAMEDITPEGPVSLFGQYYERISKYVQSPLKVTAFAIEATNEKGQKEQGIMVSMDLIYTLRPLQDALKNAVKGQILDFDISKLFLNATHTHSAPYPDVNSDYGKLLLDRLSKVVVAAWLNRKPAGISNQFGYAVVGHNRRALYTDGTAEMYGDTSRADFIGIEGPADPGVDLLYCWDSNEKLTGIIINVACPAQVTEAKYFVSADYWSEVRKQVKARFSEDVFVLAQCSAAGDISPRDLSANYKTGEPNMWDVPGMVEIGKRLLRVVDEGYENAMNHIQTKVAFNHIVKDVDLPTRRVSEEEYAKAIKRVNEIRSREPKDPDSPDTAWNRFLQEIRENEKIKDFGPWDSKTSDFGWLKPQELVLKQYEEQDKETIYNIELHVLQLGDVAFVTNPFELYVDYGFAITARSKAKQTFLIQFAGDSGGYLPTARSLEGGGYSAMANYIGQTGGQVLVNESVEAINSMWQ
ncbi:MAG: hypothetical protein ABIN04_17900 [Ginsengibacter sp.]